MRKVALSTIATVSAGQGAPKQNEFSDSGIPFVRAGSLDDLLCGKSEAELELVPDETAKKHKLKLNPKGSVLFAKSGMSATKDRIYVLQNPAYVVSHLAILIPKNTIHAEYLRLALKQFPPSTLIKDLAYPAISLREIQDYKIPVPEEPDEQKRIAYLLGKVEGLIAQRKQHLQQLNDLLKSIFLDMFGDPVRNEKGWEKRRISEFARVKIGPFGSLLHAEDYISGGIPSINPSHIVDGEIKIDDSSTITEEKFEELSQYRLALNDVIVARRGEIGRCALVKTDSKLLCGTGSMFVRITSKYSPILLQFMIFRTSLKSFLESQAKGVTMKNLNSSILENIEVINPPIDLQKQFSGVVKKVEGIRSRYKQSLTDLETLYGALSQKAFKGELDLSRVPLPSDNTEATAEENPETNEPKPTTDKFDLPAPSDLATLKSAKGRDALLKQWLTVWLVHLSDAPFSTQLFMEAAQQRLWALADDAAQQHLWELTEDDTLELGAAEYDYVRAWIFESLAKGDLAQTYDDANNRIQLKAVSR